MDCQAFAISSGGLINDYFLLDYVHVQPYVLTCIYSFLIFSLATLS
jgi:hypothetical protein